MASPVIGQQSQSSLSDSMINRRYLLGQKIGQGSFGEIYRAIDIRSNMPVAVKVESAETKYPQLLYEYRVYRSLRPAVGFPKVHWCGQTSTHTLMVMDLLGDSLESLYNKCGRKFSLKTVLMLALQLLDRIEHQHDNHYLHRDIKPDNFLMGLPPHQSTLYLIDMGLSKRYRDATTFEHIPFKDNKKLTGTPRYASINTHHGIEQCRRDDLESMGYMLMYFLHGRLPWQGLKARTKQEKYDKIGAKKLSTSVAELTAGQPKEFSMYMNYCRKLEFKELPNYQYLRNLFKNLMKQMNYTMDGDYDWMKLPDYKEQLREYKRMLAHMPALPRADGVTTQITATMAWSSNIPPSTTRERELMEACDTLESERDQWQKKFESAQFLLEELKDENLLLRAHLSLYCPVPFTTETKDSVPNTDAAAAAGAGTKGQKRKADEQDMIGTRARKRAHAEGDDPDGTSPPTREVIDLVDHDPNFD